MSHASTTFMFNSTRDVNDVEMPENTIVEKRGAPGTISSRWRHVRHVRHKLYTRIAVSEAYRVLRSLSRRSDVGQHRGHRYSLHRHPSTPSRNSPPDSRSTRAARRQRNVGRLSLGARRIFRRLDRFDSLQDVWVDLGPEQSTEAGRPLWQRYLWRLRSI